MGKFDISCHLCGDKGKDGGCPRCGLTPRKNVAVKSMHLDVPADIIPVSYQGKLWEKHEVVEGTPAKTIDFESNLEKVLNEFISGRVPSFSMFISAPPKSNKHWFAYSCMQTALVQRFSVSPMFSTSDWRRLYKVSQMNPFYKLYDAYKWDDLIKRDVVFVFVDHSDDRYDTISLLKDIFDARACFSLPTFVLSDYKLTELVPQWGKEMYSMIYNPNPSCDRMRYPVVLQCW